MWCNENWLIDCVNLTIFVPQVLLAKMNNTLLMVKRALSNFVAITDSKMHIGMLLCHDVWNYIFIWIEVVGVYQK